MSDERATTMVENPSPARVNGAPPAAAREPASHASPAPQPAADAHNIRQNLPKVTWVGAILVGLALVILFTAMFFIGWVRHTRRLDLADARAADAGQTRPIVELVMPRKAAPNETLSLPADVRPNRATAIFARASGYLKPPPDGIDIGSHVQEGQVIAEIAAPELDAQLDQARAALEQARAALVRAEQESSMSVTTLRRYEGAITSKAVSQQDLDEKRSQASVTAAAVKEAQANITAAEAAVNRLGNLQQFEKIVAPFSGVLTSRTYDTGALISATESIAGKELFQIADTSVLRVQISVPQDSATDIRVDQPAELVVKNYPDRAFAGTIARTAGAIDPGTRTLRVEVDVPNADGLLMPGMYGQVRLQVHRSEALPIIPTSAIIFDAQGLRVALVDKGRIRRRAVTLGRDFGAEVEVSTGLSADEAVVRNPGTLADGTEVDVKRDEKSKS